MITDAKGSPVKAQEQETGVCGENESRKTHRGNIEPAELGAETCFFRVCCLMTSPERFVRYPMTVMLHAMMGGGGGVQILQYAHK